MKRKDIRGKAQINFMKASHFDKDRLKATYSAQESSSITEKLLRNKLHMVTKQICVYVHACNSTILLEM